MRPEPVIRIDSAFFWEACTRGKLVAQKCPECEILWHPPRPMCPHCHSTEKTVETLSGKGRVISWAKQVRVPAIDFSYIPIAVLVELDEGIRLVSTMAEEVASDDMRFGMRVMVDFAKTSGEKAVPIFRPMEDV